MDEANALQNGSHVQYLTQRVYQSRGNFEDLRRNPKLKTLLLCFCISFLVLVWVSFFYQILTVSQCLIYAKLALLLAQTGSLICSIHRRLKQTHKSRRNNSTPNHWKTGPMQAAASRVARSPPRGSEAVCRRLRRPEKARGVWKTWKLGVKVRLPWLVIQRAMQNEWIRVKQEFREDQQLPGNTNTFAIHACYMAPTVTLIHDPKTNALLCCSYSLICNVCLVRPNDVCLNNCSSQAQCNLDCAYKVFAAYIHLQSSVYCNPQLDCNGKQ